MERTPLLSSKPSTRSFTLEPSPWSSIIICSSRIQNKGDFRLSVIWPSSCLMLVFFYYSFFTIRQMPLNYVSARLLITLRLSYRVIRIRRSLKTKEYNQPCLYSTPLGTGELRVLGGENRHPLFPFFPSLPSFP
jgi:hypothetical protein